MQLDDFIASTLSQIVSGVKQARERTGLSDLGGRPSHVPAINRENPDVVLMGAGKAAAQAIRFDVALTVTESAGMSAKVGVVSGLINGGVSGNEDAKNTSVSRVQFAIPLTLPEEESVEEDSR